MKKQMDNGVIGGGELLGSKEETDYDFRVFFALKTSRKKSKIDH